MDHPRSRGVYTSKGRPALSASGSSPLARGLPSTGSPTAAAGRDHPRSRGVYKILTTANGRDAGSSPLARGLRAGPATQWVAGPDHPRSRGVYMQAYLGKGQPYGSSPLARGLPMCLECPATRFWIIPARAGFTTPPPGSLVAAEDHPRSRGVYPPVVVYTWPAWGSSPLARGLRLSGLNIGDGPRIIPARAGFTHRVSWP